ncbi:MAG TPA: large conductance mechanosensitive channel protein MscL [Armatimonadota bacterium]|nr:large conductance mechanosensitive channel protein MscL [Armatimonadota bacterium]
MRAVKDFKEFILRGNVVDLAVAVVIGAAFGDVVKAFTKDLLTPLITIGGKNALNFSNLKLQVGGAVFLYGDVINTIVSFLLIAAVVFFFVVRPVNWLMSRRKTELPTDPATRECPECLSSIPIKATRCAFCTSPVGSAADAEGA